MAVTVGGTTITFNDATTQTTAPVNTNANVTSVSAGTGISVSSTTGAVTISATGGGTVTSIATGNGLSGGTITTTGTLTLACPSFNSVGSLCFITFNASFTSGSNYGAGAYNSSGVTSGASGDATGKVTSNNLSGTWKYLGATVSGGEAWNAIACRVS